MTRLTPGKADPASDSEKVDESGPWPFVTRRVFEAADGTRRTWSLRHHRKGLLVSEVAAAERIGAVLLQCLWMPGQLNWWIGIIFALGSLLFAMASALSLSPTLSQTLSLNSMTINAMFFAGSIPFTIAAYLQLFQAAKTGTEKRSDILPRQGTKGALRRRDLTPFLLWRPHDIGWLGCELQFIGTVLFNLTTFDAMIPELNWFRQDLLVWAPNIIGSILFLTSGYLAFIEACHAYWAWQPKSISWWVVFTNLLGCIGFMISALIAISLPVAYPEAIKASTIFTLLGAIGFLVGALLMLPETIVVHKQR